MEEIGESSTPRRVMIVQDNEQPGTSRQRRRSSVKVTSFQIEVPQNNSAEPKNETVPLEPVGISWQEEKARRRRVRRIYGTDMCQNDGEIKREKGLTRTMSDLSEKRLDRRKRLTRKLSELVLVKSPDITVASEVEDFQDSMKDIKIQETIEEVDMEPQKDPDVVVSPTRTLNESVNEPSPAASVSAIESSKQDGDDEDEAKPSAIDDYQNISNDNLSDDNEENLNDVEHETTVDVHCAYSDTVLDENRIEFDEKSESMEHEIDEEQSKIESSNTSNSMGSTYENINESVPAPSNEEIDDERSKTEPSNTLNGKGSSDENINESIQSQEEDKPSIKESSLTSNENYTTDMNSKESTQTQSKEDTCSANDESELPHYNSDTDDAKENNIGNHVAMERNMESDKLEAGSENTEIQKPTITLRDLYREIKLMRQVVAAVALPEFKDINVSKNDSDEKPFDPLEKTDDTNNNTDLDKMLNDSTEVNEIERVQEVNSRPEVLPRPTSENSNISSAQKIITDNEESKDVDNDAAKSMDCDNHQIGTDGEDSDDDSHSHRTSSQMDKEEFNESEDEQVVKDDQLEWGSSWTMGRDKAIKIKNGKGRLVIGCILHLSSENCASASVECNFVDPSQVPSVTGLHEILISNIVQVSPNYEDGQEEEITVGIPFLKYEMKYFHEVSLRVLEHNTAWHDGFFAESVFPREDDVDVPVLLASITKCETFAVVARPVTDSIVFTRDMTTAYSSVDRDIYLTCPTSARINTMDVHVELKVLPVCPEILEATQQMFDDDIRRKLYSAGAVVKIDFIDDPQTVFVHLPCIKPPSPSRPVTGGRRVPSRLGTPDSGYRSASRRSAGRKSAFGRYVEPSQEKESHLVRFSDCMTTKVKKLAHDDVTNNDKVTFTVLEKTSTSVVVDVTKGIKIDAIETVVEPLMYCLEYQTVLLCIAHHRKNLNELSLSCDKRQKVDSRKIFRLERDHNLTKSNISIKEGATICLHFRGNIAPKTSYRRIFKFYGINGVRASWKVDVVDPFGQRTLDVFCGFLQVFVWNSSKPFHRGMDNVYKYDWKLLLEVPISLPKPDNMVISKIIRAPITLRMEVPEAMPYYTGPVTTEFLEYLASCIGDEWPLVAKYLRIEHPRLQSIIQQNRNNRTLLVREVLLTWFKRSLIAKEKTSTLIHALRYSGRDDLSEKLKESYRSYKHERTRETKDQRLDKILLSVCKSELVTSKWSELALELGLYPEEISNIDNVYHNDRTRCERMLLMWKDRQNGHGFRKLVKSLRQIGRNAVADYLVTLVSRRA